MNPSNLDECRNIIKDIDSNLIELLSINENIFLNEENFNIDIIKIIQTNNHITLNIFKNLIKTSFKVNFGPDIDIIIAYLLQYFDINKMKNIDKIIELISKRIYIGHYVGDFKLNNNISKFSGLNKEDIMKSITVNEVEEKVLKRILNKCKELSLNDSLTFFILNFYKSYVILYNKRLQ